MEADHVQRNIRGGVVGNVEEVAVPVKFAASLQSHANELDPFIRIGMSSNAVDHGIVDARVRLWSIVMFAFDFVQTFPVLKIIAVV